MMKSIFTCSFLMLVLLFTGGPALAVGTVQPQPQSSEMAAAETAVNSKKLNRQQKRTWRKQLKANIKSAIQSARTADTDLLLLIIIAILIPPLGMFLYDGLSNRFWISLLLTLLFFIPGLIYTLIVILGEN